MRCLSCEDVAVSTLPCHTAPLQLQRCLEPRKLSMKAAAADLGSLPSDDTTMTSSLATDDTTNMSSLATDDTTSMSSLPTADLSSLSLLDQVMSARPGADLSEKDCESCRDGPTQLSSSSCPACSKPSFSSLNTPALGPIVKSSSRFSSTSSLSVIQSESENSHASTAKKNSCCSGSSLNVVSDEQLMNGGVCSGNAISEPSRVVNAASVTEHASESWKGDDMPLLDSSPVPETVSKRQEPNKNTERDNKHRITLPERYRRALRKSGSQGTIGSSGDKGQQDLQSREKDLGTALAWIRNEMVQMREQDSVLLKRFIELRTNILQLRCTMIHQTQGSTSDLRSLGGSSLSLNEGGRYSFLRTLARADSDVMVSEGRYATASSLSLPCSPQLPRLPR